ncbi:replication protein [Serratia fonticola]|uniref:replication endonuclease n=1 Tax=Serratia fonticola TaxID=47917 RepID=UPI000BFB4D25|nr:replication endonuclease [Serratia fonticola]ATM78956.1 replication protein [Serratia fonticola]
MTDLHSRQEPFKPLPHSSSPVDATRKSPHLVVKRVVSKKKHGRSWLIGVEFVGRSGAAPTYIAKDTKKETDAVKPGYKVIIDQEITVNSCEWSQPRAAISVDKTPAVDLVELGQEQEFLSQVTTALKPFPRFIRQRLASRIDSIHTMKGRHIARLALRDIIRRDLPFINMVTEQYAIPQDGDTPAGSYTDAFRHLNPLYHSFANLNSLIDRFNHLPDFTREDMELLAQDIAIYMTATLSEVKEFFASENDWHLALHLYQEAANVTEVFRQPSPLPSRKTAPGDADASAISKMMDARFWSRNLRKYATRWREHLHIAFGDVKRGAAPYCSKHHVDEWEAHRKRSRAIMSRLELEDKETKERISLVEQIDKSISNPVKRRVELMTRIGGFEKVANSEGFTGSFFTLTAPSKYHAYTMFGHRNAKWNGASPRKTQRYLTRLWQQIRAELARREIPVFGLRVAESHHDGTPHWHGLLFTAPEHSNALAAVMEDYATREDAEELQGKHGNRPRFEMKLIDASVGSATGYVVKYVSKNIDGHALDGEVDDESGKPLKETAKHATAWASCWGIRQFQFLGGAPVSVWRELRRMSDQEQADKINPLFAEIHYAADQGLWDEYVQLQGGPFVTRDALHVRTYYKQEDEPNAYGEYPPIIKGVYMPGMALPPIETRLHSYRIVKMNAKTDDAGQAVDLDVGFDFDLPGASAPSRTRVNNCTEPEKHTDPGGDHPPDSQEYLCQLEPEQLAFGELTRAQRKQLQASLHNDQQQRKKSPADEFEALAQAALAGDCTDSDRDRADSYLRAAHAIRLTEQPVTTGVTELAQQVQRWAEIRRIPLSKPQAVQLAQGNEVTVLDCVYRANLNTGEIIQCGTFEPWRKTLSRNKANALIANWKAAAQRMANSQQ